MKHNIFIFLIKIIFLMFIACSIYIPYYLRDKYRLDDQTEFGKKLNLPILRLHMFVLGVLMISSVVCTFFLHFGYHMAG